ncbi:DGQHR domain-containing protein [Vibrio lentus]
MSDENKITIYAFKVIQPYGEYYSAVINSELLLDVCHSREAEYIDGYITGAQRKQSEQQKKDIAGFIDSKQACFPNNIILSANYDEDDNIVGFDDRWEFEKVEGEENLYKITIHNTKAKSCSIIDGQHRLKAFEYSQKKSMALSCAIFDTLEPHAQAEIFSTINFNQRKVDKSLAYQLFGVSLDESKRDTWSPDMLAIYFCRKFNTNFEPFENRINYRLKSQEVNKSWNFSTSSFVDGFVKLISKKPKLDRYEIFNDVVEDKPSRKRLDDIEDCPLRKYYISGDDLAIEQVLNHYFSSVYKYLWKNVNDKKDNVLVSNIGLLALFDVLYDILLKRTIDKELLLSFDKSFKQLNIEDYGDKVKFPSTSKGRTAIKVKILQDLNFK